MDLQRLQIRAGCGVAMAAVSVVSRENAAWRGVYFYMLLSHRRIEHISAISSAIGPVQNVF